ncbi:MAG TPA: RsmE family RNA methyltransferase [Ktedonobacteraceae bacterium]|jgi:16S rRNA (uracil1498-N3)-methyltransferase|nr:RsmE family RNA methyltransferase [Ktedonobacteraceae bacterium]
MHRFFVAPELLHGSKIITLPEPVAHQIRDVLRLGIGEQLALLDNSGDELLCAITKSQRSGVAVQALERRPGRREPSVRVTLYQGLLKSARFEWILEKGTELGVTTFAPLLCRRSMAGLEDAGVAKQRRWQRIIQEAAEQCGRARLPALLPAQPLAHALNDLKPGALALMPWEEERECSLRDALRSAVTHGTNAQPAPLTVALFIGSEGGLTADEVMLARGHNVQIVTLGARILRAETAALATIANVMYELADVV